jgi:Cu/Ag efflux pump CusA
MTLVLAGTVGLFAAGLLRAHPEPPPGRDGRGAEGSRQVTVLIDWPGSSPEEVDDQITFPLTTRLQALAGVRAVRSWSGLGRSRVLVRFAGDVAIRAARRRVTATLAATGLPEDAEPRLAPDAGGPVFWYTLGRRPGKPADILRLWVLQKGQIAPRLQTVAGVAEVLTVGPRPEYYVEVDPRKLQAYGLTLRGFSKAVRGLRRGDKGRDIEDTLVGNVGGNPVLVRDVGAVRLGVEPRRGAGEESKGPIGGVVMMGRGEKPSAVLKRLKDRAKEIGAGLPEGVRLVVVEEPARRRKMLPASLRRNDVEVKVFGPDLPTIRRVCKEVATALEKVRGAGDIRTDAKDRPRVDVRVKREGAARHGVRIAEIGEAVDAALGGRVVTTVKHGESRIPVRVRYVGRYEKDLPALRRLPIGSPGGVIPLGTVIDVKKGEGPLTIQRENGRLMGTVGVTVRGRDVADFLKDARKAVAGIRLPRGVKIEWGRDR